MKMATRKNFHNLSQGQPNPGIMQEKVQKGDFPKKDSRELKKKSCFRFLWIYRRPQTLNWERLVFLPSKNLYRKCGLSRTVCEARLIKAQDEYKEVKARLLECQSGYGGKNCNQKCPINKFGYHVVDGVCML